VVAPTGRPRAPWGLMARMSGVRRTDDGHLKLQMPARFGEGTWMAAAWKVLADAGPEGLTVNEVRRSREGGC